MQIVGFMEDEVQSVLELVAAVLKLGNIEFKPESRVNGFDESRVKDKNGEFLSRIIIYRICNCCQSSCPLMAHVSLFLQGVRWRVTCREDSTLQSVAKDVSYQP